MYDTDSIHRSINQLHVFFRQHEFVHVHTCWHALFLIPANPRIHQSKRISVFLFCIPKLCAFLHGQSLLHEKGNLMTVALNVWIQSLRLPVYTITLWPHSRNVPNQTSKHGSVSRWVFPKRWRLFTWSDINIETHGDVSSPITIGMELNSSHGEFIAGEFYGEWLVGHRVDSIIIPAGVRCLCIRLLLTSSPCLRRSGEFFHTGIRGMVALCMIQEGVRRPHSSDELTPSNEWLIIYRIYPNRNIN